MNPDAAATPARLGDMATVSAGPLPFGFSLNMCSTAISIPTPAPAALLKPACEAFMTASSSLQPPRLTIQTRSSHPCRRLDRTAPTAFLALPSRIVIPPIQADNSSERCITCALTPS